MPLNLYTPAEGLYRTHVTWADIEGDLQRELDTVASFGPNKAARDIGDNFGFMSKILLIQPDWQRRDKKLPRRFLVKIITPLAMQKMYSEMCEKFNIQNNVNIPQLMADLEKMLKICHNAEVKTYSHLMKLPKKKKRIPKIYCAKMFTEGNPLKGYIIMKYLEDLKVVPAFENVTVTEVKQILRYKAVIEASSLEVPSDVRNEYLSPFKTIFGTLFKKEGLDQLIVMFSASGDENFVEKGDQLKAILSDIVDVDWVVNMTKLFGMESVLCHGDLWSNNILWKQKGDHLELVAVVDYQTAHFGCAATDLVRVFCGCLSGRDRRAHWEQLLEEFYGYLKEEVGDRRMPYSLEQLKEAYQQFFPIGAFMALPGIGTVFQVLSETSDEDAKKKRMDIAMEKTGCLLDDIFLFHDRNKELRKEEQVE